MTFTRQSADSRGFTLIELLLYISIIGTVLLAVSGFVAMMLASNAKNSAIAEVEQQANQVMSQIEETGQGAMSVSAPTIGATGSSLSFITPSTSPAVFSLSEGAINVSNGGGAAVPLTNSRVVASGFSVSNLSTSATAGTVQVQFTLSYVNNSGRNEFNFTKNFQTSVTIRR